MFFQKKIFEVEEKFTYADINEQDIKTVCITLGPYRNLTTLLGSLVALHPNCQVLNHAAERVLSNQETNFLVDYSDEKFSNFLKHAISISQGGQRGPYGGSILLAHAFDREPLKQTYKSRYGDLLVKKDIQCLFWKDSRVIQNFLKDNDVTIDTVVGCNNKIKFIMPIRNPMDCTVSNQEKGYARRHLKELRKGVFSGLLNPSLKSILDAILHDIAWFVELHNKYPDRFFYFFQHDLPEKNLFVRLADFLEIEPDERWICDSLNCSKTGKSYEHETDFVRHYDKLVNTYFERFPTVKSELAKFSES